MASEDIGGPKSAANDPNAIAVERLGSPEGELVIAQAVVYLACAAKSNAVYGLQGGDECGHIVGFRRSANAPSKRRDRGDAR